MFRKLLFAILPVILLSFSFNASAQFGSSISIYKMARFLHYLSSDYVDSIDVDIYVEDAIKSVLSELDPHSTYISRDDVAEMNEPLEGNFEGVGIEFNILNDTLMVVNPIAGGPSERVGIMPGDRIIKVDDEEIAGTGIKNSDVMRLLRGQKDTKVMVYIHRKGVDETLEFEITRDKIPIHSLDASYMIDPRVGYLKFNRFSLTTEQEFMDAIGSLREQGMKDLILDLSGNGGGYLNAAVSMADHFLGNNQLIVYTEGRSNPRTDFMASNKGDFKEGRLVVLIDEGSASASEIVSGAIQDWDRGVVVGRRSFGKGLVQNQMALPDGSMIRLTVARYHTPTGRVIQKPYGYGEAEEYYKDLSNRYEKGEFFSTDSIEMPDSLMYKTLNKKRVVFGGGGIMPDIFVPLDTSFYTPYYGRLNRRGILHQYAISYVDGNRDYLTGNYEDFDAYLTNFDVPASELKKIMEFAQERDIDPDPDAMEISGPEIQMQLKALVAQNFYGRAHYFKVYNRNRSSVVRALEVLNSWGDYSHLIVE